MRATVVEVACGRVLRGYAPCALVNSLAGAGFILNTEPNHFRAAADGLDAALFLVNHNVLVYELGNRAAAQSTFVVGVVAGAVEVDADCSALTPPLILQHQDWSAADDGLKASYVFFASTTRPQLVLGSGDPSPYA